MIQTLSAKRTNHTIAPEVIQLAMLLALITGLRQADILNRKSSDFTEYGLELRTRKTGKRIIYESTPKLESIVERAKQLRTKGEGTVFARRAWRTAV